jgi:hypothetical protein
MSKKGSTYQLIEDYLSGRLSLEEVQHVENRIELDPNFKNYLAQHKEANELIIKAELNQIKSKLQRIDIQKKKSVFYTKIIVRFVLSILVLLGIFIFINNKRNTVKKIEENKKEEILKLIKSEKEVIHPEDNDPRQKEDLVLIAPQTEKATLVKPTQESVDSIQSQDGPSDIDTIRVIKEIVEDIKQEVDTTIQVNHNSDSLLVNSPVLEKEPCLDFKISSELITSSSCENKHEGQIIVKSRNNKYTYSINNGNSISKTGRFTQLKPAKYELIAINERGCKSLPVLTQVEAMVCDFIIQPSQQVFWKIPLENFKADRVTLEVYNAKSGQQVYKRVLDQFTDETWNGEGLGGFLLPMGNYVYLLISENKQVKGNITIIR